VDTFLSKFSRSITSCAFDLRSDSRQLLGFRLWVTTHSEAKIQSAISLNNWSQFGILAKGEISQTENIESEQIGQWILVHVHSDVDSKFPSITIPHYLSIH
jgi:hypothetical protein